MSDYTFSQLKEGYFEASAITAAFIRLFQQRLRICILNTILKKEIMFKKNGTHEKLQLCKYIILHKECLNKF